ncbi:hypothetical protein RN001_004447 [Aquatica leii]|uniref:Polynucleotide 5'-hydroxyl-kinase NOL9 n=1 Tax=Aquatica leii TaxID=1421715 RepID=A0AAN7SPJ2_9COLE|nr:hypothetical protein RN001_004447 [Aquatica leii]
MKIGFRKTGIFPLDKKVFTTDDFLNCSVTDRDVYASSVLPNGDQPSASIRTKEPSVIINDKQIPSTSDEIYENPDKETLLVSSNLSQSADTTTNKILHNLLFDMLCLKRSRLSANNNEKLILKKTKNGEFSSKFKIPNSSTPLNTKRRKNDGTEMNIEIINYTKPKVDKLDLISNISTDSDDSGSFDFDRDCTNGLIDRIDSCDESIAENNSDNQASDGDCDAEVDYVAIGNMLLMIIPKSLTAYFDGLMSITVLKGEVDVFGYTLIKESGTKQLYSPRGCSRLYIKNTGNHTNILQQHIFANWPIKASSEQLTDIFKKIKSTDSVLLCQNIKSPRVDFLVNHISQQIYPTTGNLKCVFEHEQDGNSIRINPKWDEIVRKTTKNSKILLAGGKSVGKSTMLRYMINKLLNEYKEILLIDLDPGQPEFTVPGCVSASIVTEPLFGPNFTHLRKPARCVFVPDIDLSENPDEYIGFVEFLMSQCDNFPSMPTIINHMGFTRGLGFYILSAVTVCVQPTIIIQIKSTKSSRNYSENLSYDTLSQYANMFKKQAINSFTEPRITSITSMADSVDRWQLEPRIIREMCVLNYFGTMISKMGMAITDVHKSVYTINISEVNIRNKEGPIPMSAINGNLVALCGSVRNSNCYNCFGWAIVRGINFDNKDLYVLTPVTQSDLEAVDTLILGSVSLPPSLYMNTSNVNGLIPYIANGILNKYGVLSKRSHRRAVPN